MTGTDLQLTEMMILTEDLITEEMMRTIIMETEAIKIMIENITQEEIMRDGITMMMKMIDEACMVEMP